MSALLRNVAAYFFSRQYTVSRIRGYAGPAAGADLWRWRRGAARARSYPGERAWPPIRRTRPPADGATFSFLPSSVSSIRYC